MADKKGNKIMAYMSKNMMACDEAAYLISKSYESRLSLRKKIGLKIHLMSCHLCRKYEKQLSQLNRLMGTYKETSAAECHHHLDAERKESINKCVCKELNKS
ncbi:MAG: hypothetical protein PF450_07915 [Bacteroidales bacterium]|nr:hypothetical protein [Bacteroidales bacterium]